MNPSATRPTLRSPVGLPSAHLTQPISIRSQCAVHLVPSAIVSASLTAYSPCFVNFSRGAPRYLSSSAPISIHGLELSAASAVLLVLTAGTLSRLAFACCFCSLSASSVVRTFLVMAFSFWRLVFDGDFQTLQPVLATQRL